LIFGVNNYFIRRYTAGNAKFAGIVDRRALFVPVIDAALRIGVRGLPGGSSLFRFLKQCRP